MDVLGWLVLMFTAFTACAEFGSYAFVHPVVRKLPSPQFIRFEQGLLKTFGRAYPILMPVTGLLLVVYAVLGGGEGGPALWRWFAVGTVLLITATTLLVNVPINAVTARWDADNPPEDWRRRRARWETFQAVRAWLLLAGFGFVCIGFAIG